MLLKVKMTEYKVSYKNSIQESTDLFNPIIIPNRYWNVSFLQRAFIFLQKWNGSNVDGEVKAYTVTGYFLNYNDKSQDISGIKFTERKFLTQSNQEKIQKKLGNGKSLELIVELNNNYEVDVSKLINNNYDIKPKNDILTLEGFLYNSEKLAFYKLKKKNYNATLNNLKKDNFTQDELVESLCGLSSKN